MDKLATASLNNLRISEADVPPSEDPIFVLTASQLRGVIAEAVQEAIQSLESTVTSQGEEIRALRADEKLDHDDIRDLFDALASLEQSRIQPLQKDRGEILRALIAANGGKMLAKDARQKMHLEPWTFSKLLDTMTDCIESRPYRLKGNQKLLVLKSDLIARNMQQD